MSQATQGLNPDPSGALVYFAATVDLWGASGRPAEVTEAIYNRVPYGG